MRAVYRFPLAHEVVVAVDVQHVRRMATWCETKIEELWKGKDPSLFEAPIVCLVRYSPTYLIGELVNFSAWYACQHDLELRKELDIHPLSVTGRTLWRNQILVGRRSSSCVNWPGGVECCPSGSIDRGCLSSEGRADLMTAICGELEEEAGIERHCVQSTTVRDLYLSAEEGVFDIHIDVVLRPDCDVAVLNHPRREYEDLCWVQRDAADALFPEQQWVPLSQHLLHEAVV